MSSPVTFQPYERLANRTFIGFLIAEFLAAFNDQCIHASAMFFAINSGAMTPDKAISLMPILFYSPWAIFCTLSGYFADKYSKRHSLIFWKVMEVFITAFALLGFWLGSTQSYPVLGSSIVLSCVFLMGMHSAFYVPCKYGVLPEIFPPHLLSKANGFVESTSFLAVILGTTMGGILSYWFKGKEYGVGLFLVGSALIGTLTSYLIEKMPAIDPDRPFPGWLPWKLYAPVVTNLRSMLKSRPLALALLGIAFFTFMVAYMRATMYMHGESQNPPWEEFKISIVVGIVALGIGLGSPLAGQLSGGKVELGLVPIGAMGMMMAAGLASLSVAMHSTLGLVVTIACIGFFSGFYIVPMYTLFQHRAPKQSKGTMVATSNFVNVTGAILAQLFFYGVVNLTHGVGLSEELKVRDVVAGRLVTRLPEKNIEVLAFSVQPKDPAQPAFHINATRSPDPMQAAPQPAEIARKQPGLLQMLSSIFQPAHRHAAIIRIDSGVNVGDEVKVSTWRVKREASGETLVYYRVRPAATPLPPAYDDQKVPVYLFGIAMIMTLVTLTALCLVLPDFFVRTVLWIRSAGRYHIRLAGGKHLPTRDAAILVTNCHRFSESMHVLSVTDRRVRFILLESKPDHQRAPLLRLLTKLTGLISLSPASETKDVNAACQLGIQSLINGEMVALSIDDGRISEAIWQELRKGKQDTPIVPVYCGEAEPSQSATKGPHRIRIVVGEALPSTTNIEHIRESIQQLGNWLHGLDPNISIFTTAMIPSKNK